MQQWRQQFDKLESVDLRYDGQIIVNPDLQGMSRQPVLTPAAAKAAMAAGVKPAAIVNYEKYVTHPPPPAPLKKPAKPAAKTPARAAGHRTPSKPAKARKPSVSIARNTPPVPHAGAPATASGKNTKPVAPPSSSKTTKPAAPRPSVPAAAAGQKKPSAAIPRETAKDQR